MSYQYAYSPYVSAKYRIVSTSMVRSRSDEVQLANDIVRMKHYNAGWIPPQSQHLVYGAAVRLSKRLLATDPIEARRLALVAVRHHLRFEAVAILGCLALRLPAVFCLSVLRVYTSARQRMRSLRSLFDDGRATSAHA